MCRYVGADLSALTKEAAALAVARIFAEIEATRAASGPCPGAAALAPPAMAAAAMPAAAAAAPPNGPTDDAMASATGSAVDLVNADRVASAAAVVEPAVGDVAACLGGGRGRRGAGEGDAAPDGGTGGSEGNTGEVGGDRGNGRAHALSPEQLQGLAITMADFEGALEKVQPSVRREGFTTKPDVTWTDVVRVHHSHAWVMVFGSAAAGGGAG